MTTSIAETPTRLRRLTQADLSAAHALSAEIGWPHRLEDWQFALAAGAGVGAFERAGDLIGTTLWWPYGERIATLGLVIVAGSHQGRGIGRRMMDAALEALGRRSVVLNATQAGLRLYEATGFKPVTTVRQHQGAVFDVPMARLQAGERIRPMGRADHAELVRLDGLATGMARGGMLAPLIAGADGVVLDRDGAMAGFALIRRFGRGHVVGPVVAPDTDGAKALITHWLGSRPGLFIRIDVPARAPAISPWLAELGLQRVGEVTTMVRGEAPAVAPECGLYALVSQALG